MADERKDIDERGSEGGMPVSRIAIIAIAVLFVVVALVVVLAFLLAQGDLTNTASVIQIIRDVFLIFLSLQGVMIILALTILIAQIARLINLLQNEVQPILKNTQETVKTATGTVRFVSENVTSPLVKVSGFLAGAGVVLSNLGGIRRALRRTPSQPVNAEKLRD
jgi:hypothetical protein